MCIKYSIRCTNVVFLMIVMLTSCMVFSEQGAPQDLTELVETLINGKVYHGEGNVKANLQLKELVTDELVRLQNFGYRSKEKQSLIQVFIPIGQYYLDTEMGFFSGSLMCNAGGATDSMYVKSFVLGEQEVPQLYVQNEWSCGSLGCSFDLKFGNEKLLDNCPSTGG